MFCLKTLPSEPAESANTKKTVEDYGYSINPYNKIVKNSDSTFLNSEDLDFPALWDAPEKARHAILKQEELREAVRPEIYFRLSCYGVNPVYLSGDHGTVVSKAKPDGKHIPIWVSDDLKEKRSVILLVGEHNQEPGIFSWYSTLGEPGLNRGTAIGIMKYLTEKQALLKQVASTFIPEGESGTTADETIGSGSGSEKEGTDKVVIELDNEVDPATIMIKLRGLRKFAEMRQEMSLRDPQIPGVIILNPGQLYYSHQHNKTFTQDAWLARVREANQMDGYKIDEQHNLVPGHGRAEEHVETICTSILPELVRQDCKLFIVGIGDGAESIASSVAKQLKESKTSFFAKQRIANLSMMNSPLGHNDNIEILKRAGVQMQSYRLSDELARLYIDIPKEHFYLQANTEMMKLAMHTPAPPGASILKRGVPCSPGKLACKRLIKAYNKKADVGQMIKLGDGDDEDGVDNNDSDGNQCQVMEISAGPEARNTTGILPLMMEHVLDLFYNHHIWASS